MAEYFVYFVRDEMSGLIKIGASTCDPFFRLANGRNFNPNPLTMLGYFSGGERVRGTSHKHQAEHDLHVRFAASRKFREWFTSTPELLSFISEKCGPTPVVRRRSKKRAA